MLAVDNLSGARVGGRIVKVDHVENYKKKIAEVRERPPACSARCQHALNTGVLQAPACVNLMSPGVTMIHTSCMRQV